ncbi:MAG: hypothetical protein NC548_15950 [Lachnospiraceae bacterium]|nr:hypothetical protein [Lachnospiraceae bacterium]
MPNHVKNIVKMKGIVNLPLFTMDNGVKCFDFNKIIPMSESLNIESGSITEQAIIYFVTEKCTIPLQSIKDEYKEIVKNHVTNSFSKSKSWADMVFMRALEYAYNLTSDKKEQFYKAGETYVSNIISYGYSTWYDWCINNWDTKWNAYSNKQKGTDIIIFETAWSNPEAIMLKLSEMYPDIKIEHWWADENTGSNDGHRIYLGGKIIEGGYCGDCTDEAYEICDKCWNEDVE